MVSPVTGGGVRVPRDVDVAHPEDRAIGHHPAWVFVFSGGYFPGKYWGVAPGCAIADGAGQGFDGAKLVAGMHGRSGATFWKAVLIVFLQGTSRVHSVAGGRIELELPFRFRRNG